MDGRRSKTLATTLFSAWLSLLDGSRW